MVSRAAPFLQVMKTTYVRGRGPQRIRRTIRMTLDDAITVPDAYESGYGFMQGNETGAPAGQVPIVLSQVIPGTIRNATIRILPPDKVAPGSFGAGFAAGFHAATKLFLDVFAFDPATTILQIKVYGALVNTTGPLQEIARPSTTPVAGVFDFEIEYTSNSGAEA